MVREWLKKLGKKWFGGQAGARRAQRQPVRLGLEQLERRDVPSASIGQVVVPKAIKLRTDGAVVFGDPNWTYHSGITNYASGGTWTAGNGNTYKEWADANSTLYRVQSNGATNVVAYHVLNFAVAKDGTLWVLKQNGNLFKQTGNLSSPVSGSTNSPGLTFVGSQVSFLKANYWGDGDVWAVDASSNAWDYSAGTGWSSAVDFAFDYFGDMDMLDTSGNLFEINGDGKGSSRWIGQYTLTFDWQDTGGYGYAPPAPYNQVVFGYDYTNPYNTGNTIEFGNGTDGMVVY
jgi:hypothetical protein